ncbi:hypothetical protein EZV62_027366 [Acer yangbiense]|uniref:Anaphase-promoting complex subunit 4-like WD40 domain-containing protein n=1 Tax=Acer yangbiense TaxID=1000413 RepID=A0A5C7GUR4_9ROSI|nr:hypothetical protein EZV62_027366 [Acer yangbiense]
MDAGCRRWPIQEEVFHRRNLKENLDRFIPNRSAMDFDYAHYKLNEAKKKGEDDKNPDSCFGMSSPSREAYRRQLAEIFNMNRTRILAFKNKPPTPVELIPQSHSKPTCSIHHSKPPRRRIPQKPEKILDAPDLVDDFHLNLLDWGSTNVLAIALESTVYLKDPWDPSDEAPSELVAIDDELVTSVSWAPDGRHIAIGWNNSQVQIWDSTSNTKLRTLTGGHIWMVRMVLGIRMSEHTYVVRALAWSPFQANLLAIGEESIDGCIKFWNTHTDACLNSIDTGSLVSTLLWNKNEKEMLSSHGFPHNQLTF